MKYLKYTLAAPSELVPSLLHLGAQPVKVTVRNETTGVSPEGAAELRLPVFLLESVKLKVPSLKPGESVVLEARLPLASLDRARLLGLLHHKDGQAATLELWCERDIVAELEVTILPPSAWMCEVHPEALAGFVDGESGAVQQNIRPACRKYLRRQLGVQTFNEALDPDLKVSDEFDRTRRIATALHDSVLESFPIHYEDEPLTMGARWQKVRSQDQVLAEKQGTCIDLVLLTLACLEEAGLRPVVVMVKGGANILHVLAGCWQTESKATGPVVTDHLTFTNWLQAKELLVWDAVGVTAEKMWPFSQAVDEAAALLKRGGKGDFLWLFDLVHARTAGPSGPGISPMPFRDGPPLSEAGWQVVQQAQALARTFEYDIVERTHLLAALLDREATLSSSLFRRDIGAMLTAAKERVRRTSPGKRGVRAPVWTRSAQEVLERAKAHGSEPDGAGVVGPVQLWWALLENPGEKAGRALALGPGEAGRLCEDLKKRAHGDPQRDSYLSSRSKRTGSEE